MARSGCAASRRICRAGSATIWRCSPTTSSPAAPARSPRASGARWRGSACATRRSRWGSCSGSGNLSFSWRLIFAPEAVLDYVVAHEVAHLIEMNHGPRFWRLVASLVPDSAGPQAWLKRHRGRLFSYGGV